MKTIIAKLFAGRFNDDNIGHEVINLYKHDQADDEGQSGFYYLYVPPYGSIGIKGNSNGYSFLDKPAYKDCENILFVTATEIPYTFKIVSYARNVEKFSSGEEIVRTTASIRYNGKSLNSISFVSSNEDNIIVDDNFVSKLTYKVRKSDYFDLRECDLYLYPNKQSKAKLTVDSSKNQTLAKSPDSVFFSLDFLNTWHNYTFFYDNPSFDDWFKNNIQKYLNEANLFYPPLTYSEDDENRIVYNPENVLRFIDKENDENIVTNMMRNILRKCPLIADKFVKFLGEQVKLDFSFGSVRKIEKQYSSLTRFDKLVKKYQSAQTEENKETSRKALCDLGYSKEYIDNCPKPREGYIDLYIEGNNFRIVVENKVKSGLNDIFLDDANNQLSQLDKYQKYLLDCNAAEEKSNSIFIFAPDYHCNFDTGNVPCTIVKYSDLYRFFSSIPTNKIKIDSYYYTLFLNSLAKHSHTLANEIRERFIQITQ